MYNDFKSDITAFADKCGEYFNSGKLKIFFNSLCSDKNMADYYDIFAEHCDGGKRVRAYLVKLGYSLFKEPCDDRIIIPALSYEIFQTGVLTHDDIIDESPTRRHKPSVYIQLGGGHMGTSRAICEGDFGIIAATAILCGCEFDEKTKLNAIQHQSRVFFSTVAGELKDVDLSYDKNYTLEDVLSMYALKTAQYTVSGPLLLGAILAGADEKSKAELSEIGKNIGIAFQIKDDILGIFSEQDEIGKSNLSDMREGKKTVLSSHFIDFANKNNATTEPAHFESIYGNAASGEKELETLRGMFINSGALEFANALCDKYIQNAREGLSKLTISQRNKTIFEEFLEYMTSRKK